jgi:hypothetical protein
MADNPSDRESGTYLHLSEVLKNALTDLHDVEEVLADLPKDKSQLIYDLIVNEDRILPKGSKKSKK